MVQVRRTKVWQHFYDAGRSERMAVSVITQQPGAMSLRGWSSGLFSCCDDMDSCCYGFWCGPCFACSTTGAFGESTCLPLLDLLGPACMIAFEMPVCVPPAALSLRVAIRHNYGIQGSICEDIMASCFCLWCSWCQMAREVKEHKNRCTFQPVTFHIQPQPTITSQVVKTNQYVVVTTPPGMGNTPFGMDNTPSGMGNTPSGMGNTPSGMGNTPSGMGNTPPGMGNTPSGMGNTPSGMGNTPSGMVAGPTYNTSNSPPPYNTVFLPGASCPPALMGTDLSNHAP